MDDLSVHYNEKEGVFAASTYSNAQLQLVDDPDSDIVPYVAEISSGVATVLYQDRNHESNIAAHFQEFMEEKGYNPDQVEFVQSQERVKDAVEEFFGPQKSLGVSGSLTVGEEPQPTGPETTRR